MEWKLRDDGDLDFCDRRGKIFGWVEPGGNRTTTVCRATINKMFYDYQFNSLEEAKAFVVFSYMYQRIADELPTIEQWYLAKGAPNEMEAM